MNIHRRPFSKKLFHLPTSAVRIKGHKSRHFGFIFYTKRRATNTYIRRTWWCRAWHLDWKVFFISRCFTVNKRCTLTICCFRLPILAFNYCWTEGNFSSWFGVVDLFKYEYLLSNIPHKVQGICHRVNRVLPHWAFLTPEIFFSDWKSRWSVVITVVRLTPRLNWCVP